MRKTSLFAAAAASGATFETFDGWLLPAHFGSLPAEVAAGREGAALVDRADAAVLSLAGPDARRFCNGMFTNNVRDLPVDRANRHAMVDERARVLGLLDLWCVAPHGFVVVLDGVTADAFTTRYGKYLVFDDVELVDESDDWHVLGLQGPAAADVARAAGLPVPDAEGALASVAGDPPLRIARRARTVAGGFELLVPRHAVVAVWEGLRAAGAVAIGREAAEILRVEAGHPRWPVDMTEKSLIHELRLVESVGSFEKGCYIGQEIINRIDVMGQVTRKLWGLDLEKDALPPRGAEVRDGDDAVGETFSAVRDGGRVRVLAVLRKRAWTPGMRVTVHAGERAVGAIVRDLPFGG